MLVTRMTRSVMAVLCGLVLVGTACDNSEPGGQARTIETPAGAFIHIGSGMTFPDIAGNFVRTEIDEYDDSGEDISVGYFDREHGVVATVYVYPANSTTPSGAPPDEQHFAAVKAEIEDAFPQAVPADDDAIVMLPNLVGRKATYGFDAEFAGATRPVVSGAYLFGFEDWYIKYRVTYPESSADAATAGINELMELMEPS